MSASWLPQADAERLFALEKYYFDDAALYFPLDNQSLTCPLYSADKRENFLLDINCGRFDLKKITYQNRYQKIFILARLDFGKPHRNPDGEEIGSPHLHVYREGYGAKWATPIDPLVFRNCNDLNQTLIDFFAYCNIIEPPNIALGLF